ncbi:hypothetical protein [Cupriavidus sp. BIS7]|uniref:hypothetical protein n=1 Tax=Cupriavidus sp. BIS7 TaxID=1217718 RepID=UPI0002DA7BDB|nr:hypothetical protein [Cupriavidus sp. BIS7]
MKAFFIAAWIGIVTVTATVPVGAATKHTAAKSASKPGSQAAPRGEKWQCELGNTLYIAGDMQRDAILTLHWKGRDYKLPREATHTGADRFHDARSGLDLVVIPSKAMLFNDNLGQRLADECQTAAMQAGAAAPTQAGGLRAPVTSPLLVAPTPKQ